MGYKSVRVYGVWGLTSICWSFNVGWIVKNLLFDVLTPFILEAMEDRDVTFNQIKFPLLLIPKQLNLTCIFLSARARFSVSKPNGWPCTTLDTLVIMLLCNRMFCCIFVWSRNTKKYKKFKKFKKSKSAIRKTSSNNEEDCRPTDAQHQTIWPTI